MQWLLRPWIVFLGANISLASSPLVHAQCPEGSNGQLTTRQAYTAASDETKGSQIGAQERLSRRNVHVDDVTIDGAPDFENSIRQRINGRLPENSFEGDSGWLDALQQNAREVLQNNGYFLAKVNATEQVLSSDAADQKVSVHLQITPGRKYRLDKIQLIGAHVFPASELRSEVPLDDGEVFDLAKIRQGLEAWKHMYDWLGYVNFVADAHVRNDDDHQLVSVFFTLQEGDPFRVAGVEVRGLRPEISSQALIVKLRPGDIFNPQFVRDFYTDNKSLLPQNVSFWRSTQIRMDAASRTVAVVLDLSSCPENSGQ
jgi:outer membrane protein assembly factor BamA